MDQFAGPDALRPTGQPSTAEDGRGARDPKGPARGDTISAILKSVEGFPQSFLKPALAAYCVRRQHLLLDLYETELPLTVRNLPQWYEQAAAAARNSVESGADGVHGHSRHGAHTHAVPAGAASGAKGAGEGGFPRGAPAQTPLNPLQVERYYLNCLAQSLRVVLGVSVSVVMCDSSTQPSTLLHPSPLSTSFPALVNAGLSPFVAHAQPHLYAGTLATLAAGEGQGVQQGHQQQQQLQGDNSPGALHPRSLGRSASPHGVAGAQGLGSSADTVELLGFDVDATLAGAAAASGAAAAGGGRGAEGLVGQAGAAGAGAGTEAGGTASAPALISLYRGLLAGLSTLQSQQDELTKSSLRAGGDVVASPSSPSSPHPHAHQPVVPLALAPAPVCPLLHHICIVHNIDLAPPQTQAILQQAMRVRNVTIHGSLHNIPDPHLVIATVGSRDGTLSRLKAWRRHFARGRMRARAFGDVAGAGEGYGEREGGPDGAGGMGVDDIGAEDSEDAFFDDAEAGDSDGSEGGLGGEDDDDDRGDGEEGFEDAWDGSDRGEGEDVDVDGPVPGGRVAAGGMMNGSRLGGGGDIGSGVEGAGGGGGGGRDDARRRVGPRQSESRYLAQLPAHEAAALRELTAVLDSRLTGSAFSQGLSRLLRDEFLAELRPSSSTFHRIERFVRRFDTLLAGRVDTAKPGSAGWPLASGAGGGTGGFSSDLATAAQRLEQLRGEVRALSAAIDVVAASDLRQQQGQGPQGPQGQQRPDASRDSGLLVPQLTARVLALRAAAEKVYSIQQSQAAALTSRQQQQQQQQQQLARGPLRPAHTFSPLAALVASGSLVPLGHGAGSAYLRPPLLPQVHRFLREAVSTAYISPSVQHYAADIVDALRHHCSVGLGPCPLAQDAFLASVRYRAVLHGQGFARPQDIDAVAVACLAHRITPRAPAAPRLGAAGPLAVAAAASLRAHGGGGALAASEVAAALNAGAAAAAAAGGNHGPQAVASQRFVLPVAAMGPGGLAAAAAALASPLATMAGVGGLLVPAVAAADAYGPLSGAIVSGLPIAVPSSMAAGDPAALLAANRVSGDAGPDFSVVHPSLSPAAAVAAEIVEAGLPLPDPLTYLSTVRAQARLAQLARRIVFHLVSQVLEPPK